MDLADWSARPRPAGAPMEGRYVRLEPLEQGHADTLYQAASADCAEDRFRWLFETLPRDRAEFDAWIRTASASTDPSRTSFRIGGAGLAKDFLRTAVMESCIC